MFKLTRFTGEAFYLNPEVIQFVEDGGDTVLTLVTGDKVLIKESPDEVAQLFLEYKRSVALPLIGTTDGLSYET
jgi:flagellar protein FlbD